MTAEPWSFTNWLQGEPNEWTPNEDYIEMSNNGRWSDREGNGYLRLAIVEFGDSPVPTPTQTPSPTPTPIPTPVLNPANGHHYILIGDYLTWNDAKARAESMTLDNKHGHLVTFASQDELSWVLSNLTVGSWPVWIGACQSQDAVEPDGGWRWVTGELWSFNHWTGGEPNNAGGGENYIEMSSGGWWNDALQNLTHQSIVEFGTDAIPSPTPTPLPPPGNRALRFDGGDYIYIPSSASLDLKGPLTVAAWVRCPSGTTSGNSEILWHGDLRGGTDPYFLHVQDGRVAFVVNPTPNENVIAASRNLVDDQFHFWAGVWDQTGGKILLYKDGNLETTTSITTATLNYNTAGMWTMIGAVDNGNWQNFQGNIDEIRVYNVALTQQQVRRSMRRHLAGTEPGLAACWNFDEELDSQQVNDSSPNANNGKLGSSLGVDGADPQRIDSDVPVLVGALNQPYEVEPLFAGRRVYLDRYINFNNVPASLNGKKPIYLLTRNDDKNTTGGLGWLQLEVNAGCIVYVVWDSRLTEPLWLHDWRKESWLVQTNDASASRVVYSKFFEPSLVRLGANRSPQEAANSRCSMYKRFCDRRNRG